MKTKIILLILLLVNCKTGERLLSVSDENQTEKNLNSKILILSFENLPNKPVNLEIKLQIKNKFNLSDKFEPDYYYNSDINQHKIAIEIPKGEYFGSIKVRYRHVNYFYKSIYANHTIFFAVNTYYQKNNISLDKCSHYTSDSGSMSEFTMISTFCDTLTIDNKSKKYVFSFQKQEKLNEGRTAAATIPIISILISKAYPLSLVVSLFYYGFYGLFQYESLIELKRLESN